MRATAIWLLPAVLLLAACNNPFSTRTPEEPPSSDAVFLPPTSPEKVLHNLQESIRAKSIQDYLGVFSDDFVFAPDPGDSLAYEQYFRSRWDRGREEEFALNFFQQAQQDSTVSLKLTTYSPWMYQPGERMYIYPYLLSYSRDRDKTEVYGRAFLYFRENEEGKWSIYLWADQRVLPNSPTWGEIRAQYL
jgi:ketosteroid isomerase-like protein